MPSFKYNLRIVFLLCDWQIAAFQQKIEKSSNARLKLSVYLLDLWWSVELVDFFIDFELIFDGLFITLMYFGPKFSDEILLFELIFLLFDHLFFPFLNIFIKLFFEFIYLFLIEVLKLLLILLFALSFLFFLLLFLLFFLFFLFLFLFYFILLLF